MLSFYYMYYMDFNCSARGGSRAAATSKMECFVIIVNGFRPLTIITKHSILDIAATLDPPLSAIQLDHDSVKIYQSLHKDAFPVDTGCKLNVLCTFTLRHVSTGLLRFMDKAFF